MSWQEVSIDQIASVVTKGTTPTTYGMPFVECGINFIKAESLNGEYSLDNTSFNFIDERTHEKLARSQLNEHDVLVTIAGVNVGKCGLVRAADLPANTNQAVGIIRINQTVANPRFVYYHFKLPSTRRFCLSVGGQAAQPNVNLTVLKSFKLFLPELSVQIRIASILSAYDDLMENNRRRIQLLEQAIRLLYKEWFINLRFPGHEHVKIINGVPEGWESGEIADFFETASGGTPSRNHPEFYEGDINWVKTKELNEDFIFDTEEKITADALIKSAAKLFPENTLLVSIYGGTNIGRTGILAKPAASNQACVALLPIHTSANHIYAQLFFQHMRESLIGIAQGSAQTNISQQTLRKVRMIMPTRSIMQSFLSNVSPVYDQLKILKRQNEMLLKARDLLLPRLMSGDVAV